MKQKIMMFVLGFYNLILAVGAISTGVMMLTSNSGIFAEYPKEWISKTPFESWFIIGIIAILLFGIGNIIAAILSYKKVYIFSVIMGGIFFTSLVLQVVVLGEWYLATLEFLILSMIQLFLSVYSFISYKKVLL
jgi:hypothetical protein